MPHAPSVASPPSSLPLLPHFRPMRFRSLWTVELFCKDQLRLIGRLRTPGLIDVQRRWVLQTTPQERDELLRLSVATAQLGSVVPQHEVLTIALWLGLRRYRQHLEQRLAGLALFPSEHVGFPPPSTP